MHPVLNFVGTGILSAMLSVVAIIGNAMLIDKDPAVDGPRALLAEFFGLWVTFAFLAWSFMVAGPGNLQWTLRGIAAGAAVVTVALAAYFAGTPEVRIKLDRELTGFDNPVTSLHLDTPESQIPASSESNRRRGAWSELDPLT